MFLIQFLSRWEKGQIPSLTSMILKGNSQQLFWVLGSWNIGDLRGTHLSIRARFCNIGDQGELKSGY